MSNPYSIGIESPHCLRSLAGSGASGSKLGLLEPISEMDTLALAWAKAATMADLGASALALQQELSRVMEPHANGSGALSSIEFDNPDAVTLRSMAEELSCRQARQLAQDVGLAAASLAEPTAFEALRIGLAERVESEPVPQEPKALAWAGAIGALGRGAWFDPLGMSRFGADSLPYAATFAFKRLAFKWPPA